VLLVGLRRWRVRLAGLRLNGFGFVGARSVVWPGFFCFGGVVVNVSLFGAGPGCCFVVIDSVVPDTDCTSVGEILATSKGFRAERGLRKVDFDTFFGALVYLLHLEVYRGCV